MGMLSGLQRFFNFSPSKWVGTNQIKEQSIGIKAMIKAFFIPQKAKRVETFEEALARLGLSDADLQQRAHEFQFLLKIFIGIASVVFLYEIYLLFIQAWWPAAGTVGILLIVLSQIFRYHFWLFQIRQRKLGCSFREWLANLGGVQ